MLQRVWGSTLQVGKAWGSTHWIKTCTCLHSSCLGLQELTPWDWGGGGGSGVLNQSLIWILSHGQALPIIYVLLLDDEPDGVPTKRVGTIWTQWLFLWRNQGMACLWQFYWEALQERASLQSWKNQQWVLIFMDWRGPWSQRSKLSETGMTASHEIS